MSYISSSPAFLKHSFLHYRLIPPGAKGPSADNLESGKLEQQLLRAGVAELHRSLGVLARPLQSRDGAYPESIVLYQAALNQISCQGCMSLCGT